MNRRTFTIAGTAALVSSFPSMSLSQLPAGDTPGYQVAETSVDGIAEIHGGMAAPGMPVNSRTLFQVASCSKTVTGLAVLTLVRDGHLVLDRPANQYLQRWQLPGPRGDRATIAELLSHTAGTTVHGFEGYGPDDDIPDLLDILAGRPPANSGAVRARRRWLQRFDYSGGGTTVLQCLIEDITGFSFGQYVAAEVLGPIGAHRTTFDLVPRRAFAHGALPDGQPLPGGFRRHPESAAAGLWATATDLVKILQAILLSLNGARGAILPVPLAQRMITPMAPHSGLGILVKPGEAIWHDGRNEGFDSAMAAELDTGRVRAAVSNQNGTINQVLALQV